VQGVCSSLVAPNVVSGVLGGLFLASEALGLMKHLPHNSVTDVVIAIARTVFVGSRTGPPLVAPSPLERDVEHSVELIVDALVKARADADAADAADAAPGKEADVVDKPGQSQ
jgi:hypothetical protein